MSTLQAGSHFGKFRILRLLGQGGMADLYEAKDTQLGRTVALNRRPPGNRHQAVGGSILDAARGLIRRGSERGAA